MQAINFLLAGVGGQGVLTSSDIVAEAGLVAGYDAKKSEIHGFSQRGGVVESHVRWAKKVFSPNWFDDCAGLASFFLTFFGNCVIIHLNSALILIPDVVYADQY